MGMSVGTLTVEDSFDAVMGKWRGLSPDHGQERLRLSQDEMQRAISGPWQIPGMWQAQGVADALDDLYGAAHDSAPEIQAHLRSVICELISASGMGAFAAGWRRHKESLCGAMNDAVSDALVTRLSDNDTPPYARRREAWTLARGIFLDKEDLIAMSYHELEAYSPIVEVVALVCKEDSLEEDVSEEDEYRQNSCNTLAVCLGICHSEFLPLLQPWRDELTREVAAGNCDGVLTSLMIALHSSKNTLITQSMTPERKAFLKPLNEAIEKRRTGE